MAPPGDWATFKRTLTSCPWMYVIWLNGATAWRSHQLLSFTCHTSVFVSRPHAAKCNLKPEVSPDTSRKFPLELVVFVASRGIVVKMATSRRASQQQPQNVSSPPRTASTSLTPPGSPPGAGVPNISPPPAGGEQDGPGDAESSAASSPAPLRSASSTSSSSTSTSSASSPSTTGGSSPDSASTSPAGGCASGGAFRELFEACRNGDVSRVKRLVDSVNVNSKDMAGRKSTPLHFAAGKRRSLYFTARYSAS